MQTVASQKTFMAERVVRAGRPARASVVVRASAEESRRAVLSGMLAGVAALGAASSAKALDIIDDRKARATGFDIIYEARDLDLPQGQRDGLTQVKEDPSIAKKRIVESQKRIENDIEPFIKKNYWTEAREQLRRQVGTLRFDLNTLSAQLPKAGRKEAQAATKVFAAEVAALDLALRKKDEATALKEFADVKTSLSAVLSKLG